MDWTQITTILAGYGAAVWGYIGSPPVLIQLGVIAVLFLPALVLSWRVEPRLVEWANGLQTHPTPVSYTHLTLPTILLV